MILRERADKRVGVDERERFLVAEPLAEFAKRTKPEEARGKSHTARPVNDRGRMFGRERDEALENTNAFDPALFDHGPGPEIRVGADPRGFGEQVLDPAFDAGDLLIRDMAAIGLKTSGTGAA